MPRQLLAIGRAAAPVLDAVYRVCGGIAAVFLIAILGLIVAQMAARWTGQTIPGSIDYAGYCMAAASFFAMAYTLNHGAHIRVNLLLQQLAGRKRRALELWCFGVGTALAWYFAYFAWKAIRVSHLINDVSQGQDATPLWIPQLAMGVGMTVLSVALTDNFLRLVFVGEHAMGSQVVEDHHTE